MKYKAMKVETGVTSLRFQLFCAFVICVMWSANAQTTSTTANARQAADPRNLVLLGDPFKPLNDDEMTPEQKIIIDHLLADERGGARGLFNVLLRSPEVGDLGAVFGGAMRFRTDIPKDVSEMVIIMTGRFWMAQYEWTGPSSCSIRAIRFSTFQHS
jgi:hypothetical protein